MPKLIATIIKDEDNLKMAILNGILCDVTL
jgi:hypothetical protein